MFWKRFHLLDLFGFPIYLDLSWFVIAALVAWSLARSYFPFSDPGLGASTYWAMGVAGALGLFASVLLHELGHAVVARREDLPIRRITLFIFGGVAELSGEPRSARVEFLVAIGGPLVSLGLAFAFLAGGWGAGAAAAPQALTAVLTYLGRINAIVLAFNLIPAFPLDGGRVLRSALWAWKGNLAQATRVTTALGGVFGLALIGLGILAFLAGQYTAGVWWALIGLFLRNAAQLSYQQVVIRRALEGEPLARFVTRDPVTVSPGVTMRDLVENWVYRYHYKLFPVVDGDRLVGCVRTRQLRHVPRDEWDRHTVAEYAEPCTRENTIGLDADAMDALTRMNRNQTSRLLVVDGDRLVGIVSLKDMLRFLSLKVELGDA